MGKAENRKRAKLLKEAKRKREQEALIAAGKGPAGQAILNKYNQDGIKTRFNSNSIKYSDLLKEFVQPILNLDDSLIVTKSKFLLGIQAWNAATVRETDEEKFQAVRADIVALMPDAIEIEQTFDNLVKRKQEKYLEFKNLIVDFEMEKIHGSDYDLSVVSIPIIEEN